jgi:hypothetical protein
LQGRGGARGVHGDGGNLGMSGTSVEGELCQTGGAGGGGVA